MPTMLKDCMEAQMSWVPPAHLRWVLAQLHHQQVEELLRLCLLNEEHAPAREVVQGAHHVRATPVRPRYWPSLVHDEALCSMSMSTGAEGACTENENENEYENENALLELLLSGCAGDAARSREALCSMSMSTGVEGACTENENENEYENENALLELLLSGCAGDAARAGEALCSMSMSTGAEGACTENENDALLELLLSGCAGDAARSGEALTSASDGWEVIDHPAASQDGDWTLVDE